MVARSLMTMRVSTERDDPNGQRDDFNQSITSVITPLTNEPCYWQVQRERFVSDDNKLMAVAVHIILMPITADIKEQDRVIAIKDRRGRSLKSTKLIVKTVVRREDHQEISLDEYN